ncbi:ADP-ribosylation factor-like protein 2-binding protein [Kappamyces sp. JEL0680]|nr:ADP-ribosylation factor-like protein 2-binding protein [Kappamyces sp. JEL0680]
MPAKEGTTPLGPVKTLLKRTATNGCSLDDPSRSLDSGALLKSTHFGADDGGADPPTQALGFVQTAGLEAKQNRASLSKDLNRRRDAESDAEFELPLSFQPVLGKLDEAESSDEDFMLTSLKRKRPRRAAKPPEASAVRVDIADLKNELQSLDKLMKSVSRYQTKLEGYSELTKTLKMAPAEVSASDTRDSIMKEHDIDENLVDHDELAVKERICFLEAATSSSRPRAAALLSSRTLSRLSTGLAKYPSDAILRLLYQSRVFVKDVKAILAAEPGLQRSLTCRDFLDLFHHLGIPKDLCAGAPSFRLGIYFVKEPAVHSQTAERGPALSASEDARNVQLSTALKIFIDMLPYLPMQDLTARFLVLFSVLSTHQDADHYWRDCFDALQAIVSSIDEPVWPDIANQWIAALLQIVQEHALSDQVISFVYECGKMHKCRRLVGWARSLSLSLLSMEAAFSAPVLYSDQSAEVSLARVLDIIETQPRFKKTTPSFYDTHKALALVRHHLSVEVTTARKIATQLRRFHNSIDDRMAMFLERSAVKEELLRISTVIDLLITPLVWSVLSSSDSSDDDRFDIVVGELEDILMGTSWIYKLTADDGFVRLQSDFMKKFANRFTSDDENKIEYTEIFHEYTAKIEHYISVSLTARLDWFKMADFMEQLCTKKGEDLQGDVFDLLHSLGDFEAFKELVLSYKAAQEGKQIDLSGLLSVTRA